MSPSTIHDVRRIYQIASIPGDGIGPEVISAGIQVLEKLASILGEFEFHFDHLEWSSDYYKKHGKYIPDGGLESLRKYDAILFGSVGAPGPPPHLQNQTARHNLSQQTSQTISPSGPSASPSANPSNNTPMSAPPNSSAASLRPCATLARATLTG